jgi:hypothetical protein
MHCHSDSAPLSFDVQQHRRRTLAQAHDAAHAPYAVNALVIRQIAPRQHLPTAAAECTCTTPGLTAEACMWLYFVQRPDTFAQLQACFAT